VESAIGRNQRRIGRKVEMNKVIPLTKNHKDYEDVPDGIKWAIPIHECLEKPEVKERSRRLEEESKRRVKKVIINQSIELSVNTDLKSCQLGTPLPELKK